MCISLYPLYPYLQSPHPSHGPPGSPFEFSGVRPGRRRARLPAELLRGAGRGGLRSGAGGTAGAVSGGGGAGG